MIYRQIQNGAFLLDYAGERFLVDPVMEEQEQKNWPSASLGDLLNVDAVIVTHLSEKCFDQTARRLIPRGKKVFVPTEEAARELKQEGFLDVEVLKEGTVFHHLSLKRIPSYRKVNGNAILDESCCGVVIFHPVLNTVYIAGRSAWYEGMKSSIKAAKPRVVVVSTRYTENGGSWEDSRYGVTREEIAAVHLSYPRARIIATQRRAREEESLSRSDLRSYVSAFRLEQAVLLPEDGELYRL